MNKLYFGVGGFFQEMQSVNCVILKHCPSSKCARLVTDHLSIGEMIKFDISAWAQYVDCFSTEWLIFIESS